MKSVLTALPITDVALVPTRARVTDRYSSKPCAALVDCSGSYRFFELDTATRTVGEDGSQLPETSVCDRTRVAVYGRAAAH